MSVDIKAIRARAEAATPIVAVGLSKANAKFFEHAKGDVLALIAEVERLNVMLADSFQGHLLGENQRLSDKLVRVTAERDAAVEDLTLSNTRKFNNPCEFCKKSGKNCAPVDIQDVCKAWEWRGERSGENG